MMDEQLKVDGYDAAIIGICAVSNRFVYSIDRMVNVFIEAAGEIDDDDDIEGMAIDYILFNIVGAYVGEMTPIFMYDYNANFDEWGDEI